MIQFTRQSLVASLEEYKTSYGDELLFRDRFLKLLEHPRCFHRDFLPGHLTGSAFITDTSAQHVLLTHHAKLDRWLQPGGHADGDEDIFAVALREAREETGLKNLTIMREVFFDIDIHGIPARKDFPAHDHYDVRFLLTADPQEPLQITDESIDLKWVPLDDLESYTDEPSILRMREKARQ
ncbi:MAG TPA: NUDIX hydrolase [Ohtaekwangia sp.]|nr:NUDIX hydrolase [Ohtaekwangia sp.]